MTLIIAFTHVYLESAQYMEDLYIEYIIGKERNFNIEMSTSCHNSHIQFANI